MTEAEVIKGINECITEEMHVSEDQLKPEAKIKELDPEPDSLDVIELCMKIENKFNIHLSDEEIEKQNMMSEIYTLKDFYAFVIYKIG